MTQQQKVEQVNIPKLFLRGSFQPETLNAEKRTVTVIWSTGEKVLRGGFFTDPFYEELSLDPQSVRMSRLNNGAPVLNAHAGDTLSDITGVVERAWLENGLGYAELRFSDREDVQPFFKDIQDGIIRNVSVGYRVYKYQDVSGENDKVRTLRATDWEPMELSMVPIPADAGAGVRSDKDNLTACEITSRAEEKQNEETPIMSKETLSAAKNETAAIDADSIRKEAVDAERKRAAEISSLSQKHGIENADALRLIESGASVDEVRAQILDILAERSSKSKIDTKNSGVEMGRDLTVESRREGAIEALLYRFNPKDNKLTEKGYRYRGLSLLEMARSVLEESKIEVRGLSKDEIARRAFHSTSDFPNILANVANKSLRQGYENAPQTFRPFVREVFLPDFKQASRIQLGEAPKLELVNQSGEIKSGTLGESAEKYQLATYGKIIAINRQVIINDDLEAFTRVPLLFGRAAADLESDLVYSVLTANAAMSDGVALFHANHKNLGTAAAISVVSLTEARKLMRLQTGLQTGKDKQILNIQGKYLVVPAAIETTSQQTVAPIAAAQAGNVNPFSGAYIPIVEPRLDASSGTAWYLIADPAQIDTIELAYLQDQRGVYTETEQGFEVDGLRIKARLDAAAKAIDYRGMVKNAGL